MQTILFWNTKNNGVDAHLLRSINHWNVDVFALAESAYDPQALVDYINPLRVPGTETFTPIPPTAAGAKIQLFSRLKKASWKVEFPHKRYTGWTVQIPDTESLLVVAAHFPAAMYEQGDGQRKTAIELRYDIEAYERRFPIGAQSKGQVPLSLIIGDFNASPFDGGIAGFYGMNASGHRDIVEKQGHRILGGQKVKFYYNPMWRFFGNKETPGTFFDRLSAPVCYDWFLLDQVLLSPGLLAYFQESDIHILNYDADPLLGGFPLTESAADKPLQPIATISDPLPIVVRLTV